ncbi:MAG: hypothetical protein QHG99_02720 [Methanomicrobiales archaeon]|nr:hypothetical protein [Methanomicrobiales archaeon]
MDHRNHVKKLFTEKGGKNVTNLSTRSACGMYSYPPASMFGMMQEKNQESTQSQSNAWMGGFFGFLGFIGFGVLSTHNPWDMFFFCFFVFFYRFGYLREELKYLGFLGVFGFLLALAGVTRILTV